MVRKTLLGHKVRKLRRDNELSQVAMAERLGISPSYLNLIEHNQRPLTLPLVLKLSRLFDVDLQTFSDEDEVRLVANLEEVFGDALFQNQRPDSGEIQDLVGAHPEVCRALIALHDAYRNAGDTVHTLRESLSGETILSTSSHQLLTLLTSIRSFSEILHDNADLEPRERERFLGIILREGERLAGVVGEMLEYGQGEGTTRFLGANSAGQEVSDFIEENGNFFPELENGAAELGRDLGFAPGSPVERLTEFLDAGFQIQVERAPADGLGMAVQRFDPDQRRLVLSEALPHESVRFCLAHQIGLLAASSIFETCAADPALTTDASRELARAALARYFAAALVMPYDDFLEAARTLRHDIELLQQRFSASFEQVCHRLTTLRRPGAAGIPFHLVRVDIAGNISKRFSGSGMRIPRFGGACPRWNVHAAFTTPGVIRAQAEQLPDGTTYFSIARSFVKIGGGHNMPKSHLAISIGCEQSYAAQIVYADGIVLENNGSVMPVGVTCRLCERTDCAQRAFPQLIRGGTVQYQATDAEAPSAADPVGSA